jgi:signal transduction histidine kinase
MKQKSFSNRIALYFLFATATLIVVIFFTIYAVVYRTVYSHLDDDLNAESLEVFHGIVTLSDRMIIANENEWVEGEHSQIEVNPTFVQITDTSGTILRKSPNLEQDKLEILPDLKTTKIFDTHLAKASVRQLQMPISNHLGQSFGYLSIAIPLEESQLVLRNLRMVLLLTLPLVLLILYYVIQFIARKSIYPVHQLTHAAQKINRENLDLRIELPKYQDELFTLVETINSLLDRLQEAVLREKQFTADASHELRTPLSSLKGTLEVILRKPREPEHYIQKIQYSLEEVNRMTILVEQLLLLARYESIPVQINQQKIRLEELIHVLVVRLEKQLEENKISLNLQIPSDIEITTDRFMLEQVLENLLTNAVKYSFEGGEIEVKLNRTNEKICLIIQDFGVGMTKEQSEKIFQRFYRADESRNFSVPGNGLGMAIVKRFSDILQLNINIESSPSNGTKVEVVFPSKLES